MRKKRWTVGVDVDGVLHSYVSGWQGADVLPDAPVPGAIEWLEEITREFDVAIVSTRCNCSEGREAVRAWLVEHGLSERALACVFTGAGKGAALLYVDDRAWRFTGDNWPSVSDIHTSHPWWKGPQSA